MLGHSRRFTAALSAGAILSGALAIGAVPASAATPSGPVEDKILELAAAELGTTESGGDNCQPYSSQCVAWCSLFAMWVWEEAGVDVENDDYAFTGNVYYTGQDKGTAYDSGQLDQAAPGDVLLFGTGPDSPDTSTHIGIVEKVEGDTVTTIEGNAGDNTDSVVRNEHTLSSDTFYGGVHPW